MNLRMTGMSLNGCCTAYLEGGVHDGEMIVDECVSK